MVRNFIWTCRSFLIAHRRLFLSSVLYRSCSCTNSRWRHGAETCSSNIELYSCMLSFGWFPGVWNLYADISEHSVCSILIGR